MCWNTGTLNTLKCFQQALEVVYSSYRPNANQQCQSIERTEIAGVGGHWRELMVTSIDNEKKRSERLKHCTLAVVRRSLKFSPHCRAPSRGCGMAKVLSAGDGHYLHLQTQFGED